MLASSDLDVDNIECEPRCQGPVLLSKTQGPIHVLFKGLYLDD